MHAVLLEDIPHRLVAANVALVAGILQIVPLDVFPQALRNFGSR